MISKGLYYVKHFLSGEKKAPDSRPPHFLHFRSSSIFILATVCIAIFTDILVYGIIVPVIPFALTSRVGVSEDTVQTWNAILLASYTIALFVASPLVGIYADHTSSRRWPLLMGLLALAACTIFLCLGRSIAVLIVGRILQGISAAVVWTVGLALMVDTVPNNVGQAMGYSSLAMSLGLLVSPAIGGAVFAGAGYYAVYYIAFGCLAFDIVMRLILIEKKVARQWIDDEGDSDPEQGAADAATGNQVATVRGGVSGANIAEKRVDGTEHDDRATAVVVSPTAPSVVPSNKTAKHPKLKVLKSRRILGANFGIIIQAGLMCVLALFV